MKEDGRKKAGEESRTRGSEFEGGFSLSCVVKLCEVV